jgi:hypothetical protein
VGRAGEECGHAGEREGERAWAGFGPAKGGFPFSFSFFYFFPISISLIPFSFKQKNSYNFLGVQNEILYVKCY